MRIKSKIRYATRILTLLNNSKDDLVSLKEIETQEEISAKYAKKLMQSLEKKGLIKSKKGPKGGYQLAKKPENIILEEIFSAYDEKINLTPCQNNIKCTRDELCSVSFIWKDLRNILQEYISSTTLKDIIMKGENDG